MEAQQFLKEETGYQRIQGTKPQTLAYGLNDSPAGLMVDSPAIATASYGRGRVVFVSPHPEQTPGLEDLVHRGAQWAAGKP